MPTYPFKFKPVCQCKRLRLYKNQKLCEYKDDLAFLSSPHSAHLDITPVHYYYVYKSIANEKLSV